jgi:hypothetical protein
MRNLSYIFGLFILGVFLYSCSASSTKKAFNSKGKEEPVVIANDSLEYEIIIFDVGFNYYLRSIARPIGFYSKNYMKNWNIIYVTNWNIRVQNPTRYDANIYANIIEYDPKIDYGLEVNYKLFNYFQFAQRKYRMRLDTEVTTTDRIR